MQPQTSQGNQNLVRTGAELFLNCTIYSNISNFVYILNLVFENSFCCFKAVFLNLKILTMISHLRT